MRACLFSRALAPSLACPGGFSGFSVSGLDPQLTMGQRRDPTKAEESIRVFERAMISNALNSFLTILTVLHIVISRTILCADKLDPSAAARLADHAHHAVLQPRIVQTTLATMLQHQRSHFKPNRKSSRNHAASAAYCLLRLLGDQQGKQEKQTESRVRQGGCMKPAMASKALDAHVALKGQCRLLLRCASMELSKVKWFRMYKCTTCQLYWHGLRGSSRHLRSMKYRSPWSACCLALIAPCIYDMQRFEAVTHRPHLNFRWR